jgi:hypothetical protein
MLNSWVIDGFISLPVFLAHLTQRVMWAIVTTECPSSVRPLTFHILINSSEATGPIWTKLWWNGPWMAPFQNCVRWSRLPTKMAAKLKIEKRGDEILIVDCCFSKSKWAQILTAATWQGVVIFRVFLWNFSFSRYISIMQIRHILIKDHI